MNHAVNLSVAFLLSSSLSLDQCQFYLLEHLFNNQYAVADPAAGVGGAGSEKHEIYPVTFGSHLFMTYFYSAGGSRPPCPPPESATNMQREAETSACK